MRGGVVGGCCCAVGEGAAYGTGVDFVGLFGGGKGSLEREGVGLEPGEEGRGAEDAGVGMLGGVGMGV